LSGEPVNLIITVGPGEDASQFAPLPENTRVESYIPQSLLFPHCDLAILSGSSNTVMGALSHGLPMLLIPLSSTQPLHAMRCTSLGIGCVLKQPGIFDGYLYNLSYAELSPESVRIAVKELFDNQSYRQNAQRLRKEIESLPGCERAVELLTGLAREKTSQLRPPGRLIG
jgi:UDP:flavonoid glycosyltransferase YjiC (YdhE family)